MTTLTQNQFESLKRRIYNSIMATNPDFGLGEGGEVEMMAESLINDWAEKENIAIQN